MIGYFQLFAEPYVMTQGGRCGARRASCCCMYEEGFRWWRMGYAAAIAFVLFVVILAVRRCCSCGCRRSAHERARERRSRARQRSRSALRRARSLGALLALLADALDGLGVVHADRRGEHLSAALLPEHADLRALPRRCSPGSNLGRYLLNSAIVAVVVTVALAAHQLDGRLRVRQAALPRPRPAVPRALDRARAAGAGGDAAALPADEERSGSSTPTGA